MRTIGLGREHIVRLMLFGTGMLLAGCDINTASTNETVNTASQDLAMFIQDFVRQLLAAFLL